MKLNVLIARLLIFGLCLSPIALAKLYGQRLCQNDDRFICHTVKKGETWQKLFPNEEKRLMVRKLNRMNTNVHTGMVIAVPKTQDGVTLMDFTPFQTQIDPSGEKKIVVSLNKLAFGAYNPSGTLVYWGPVSGGRDYCPDTGRGCHTKTGKFAIYNKGGQWCVSSKFPVGRGGAPMPYCMYFNGGYALHGSYEVPGYNDSHGCVRMFVDDAKWLNTEFTHGEKNVPVVVYQ